MLSKTFTYKKIPLGHEAQFTKIILQKDVVAFANLTGDHNPLHLKAEFAKKTSIKTNIVHGMLTSSFFSTLVGMYCPGKYSLIVKQEIKYLAPVYINTPLKIYGKIIQKSDATKMIKMETFIFDVSGKLKVSGIIFVKLLR